MNNRIIELKEYKNAITDKYNIDSGSITIDDLSLEEIEDVKKIYQKDINNINDDIQKLTEKNKQLKRILEK